MQSVFIRGLMFIPIRSRLYRICNYPVFRSVRTPIIVVALQHLRQRSRLAGVHLIV